MKTLLLTLSLVTAAVSTSRAEIYRPSVVAQTTVFGAVAGALIGGHNNDHWAQGAVIGAAAGALIGTAIDHSAPVVYQNPGPQYGPVYGCAPVVVAQAPQVVYVAPAPRVVYVAARPVYVRRPVVYVAPNHSHGHHNGRDGEYDRRW